MPRTLLSSLAIIFFLSIQAFAQEPIEGRTPAVPDLHTRVVLLVKPAFPESAVAAGADGAFVSLQVVVNENGDVIFVQCLTCHAMLKDAAELAAMSSKFKPLEIDGRKVRYRGTLYYNFVVNRVDWYGFGKRLESTRQFDNIALGPTAQTLTNEYAAEKASLLGLDAGDGADYDTRQKVIAEVVRSIKSKLKGVDLWWFDVAMALRRVTFWPQGSQRINRIELQKSLDELTIFVASPPEGVSVKFIKDLTAISKIRGAPEISEQDLREAISNLARNIPNDPK